ncbi:ATP-binding protein [Streptomyces kebangsaanensis]|uniref:ATP-binding protein n=1 Tax=Streptomyces kebangsaanensis TaxID=864058 RepID=A0ABW6KQZ8_9ACTN
MGRKAHVDALLELLSPKKPTEEPVVISAISGLAGIGKTALALHVAHRARDLGWFPGGTIFIDLHGYDSNGGTTAEQALGTLLRALGIRDDDVPASTDDQIGLYLTRMSELADQNLPVLIILDNVSNAAQVESLLPGRSEHRVLITSRHTLATLPARLIDLDRLTVADASDLIARSLSDARPNDNRPSDEARALEEIAKLCGCLPLALQIVAALLKAEPYRPIASLLTELEDSNTRLEALQYQDIEGRSLAVKAAFDLSYERLDTEHARLFRLLSLCPGQVISSRTASALLGAHERRARRLLADLAQAHLIDPVAADSWRVHDLIILYASELSQNCDEGSTIAESFERLVGYYQSAVHAACTALGRSSATRSAQDFPDRESALSWFDQELPNLMAIVKKAGDTNPEASWSLILHLHPYLIQSHHFDEAVSNAEAGVQIASTQGWRSREGVANTLLGASLSNMNAPSESAKAYQRAAAIFTKTGERIREGHALADLGVALTSAWKFDDGVNYLRQAVSVFRQEDELQCEAHALRSLGHALSGHGAWRNNEALAIYEEALEISRKIGDRRGEAATLNYIGKIMMDQGQYRRAISLQRKAVKIFSDLDYRNDQGVALNTLGDSLYAAGRYQESAAAHRSAVEIAQELGRPLNEAYAMDDLGLCLKQLGLFEEAIQAHRRAVEIYREIRHLHREGHALFNLADALVSAGKHKEAESARARASKIFKETGVHSRTKRTKDA